MLRKIWDVKLTRFASVGVFNTLFDISILNVLVFLFHIPTLIANLISASISITVSYFLNHHIVFRSDETHSLARFAKFFAITGTGILVIQTVVIYSVTHLLAHQEQFVANVIDTFNLHISVKAFELNVAKLCAVAIAMTWNFMLYHFVVFKKPGEEPDEDILL